MEDFRTTYGVRQTTPCTYLCDCKGYLNQSTGGGVYWQLMAHKQATFGVVTDSTFVYNQF